MKESNQLREQKRHANASRKRGVPPSPPSEPPTTEVDGEEESRSESEPEDNLQDEGEDEVEEDETVASKKLVHSKALHINADFASAA